jgi:hypothetical protein
MKLDNMTGRTVLAVAVYGVAFAGCGGPSAGSGSTSPTTPGTPTATPVSRTPVASSACERIGEGTFPEFVDLEAVKPLSQAVTLKDIKSKPALASFDLVKQPE